jgi:hypothetical protein
MRRYAVRFLVAVLTFGIGVALSLAFGLFRVQETTRVTFREYRHSRDCPKKFRVARPAFLNVDSQSTDPLGLVYLGTAPDITGGDQVRMRFAVGNRSEKTISGYWIKANEIWKSEGQPFNGIEWTAFEMLEPGDTNQISLPGNVEGAAVRVYQVTFKDGSIWTNPRVSE